MRRIVSVLAAAVVLAAGLTACSTTVNETRNAALCGPFSSGSASDAVSAKWTAKGPKTSFPTPLSSPRTQVTVLRKGTGAGLQNGDIARIGFSLSVGDTGRTLQTDGYGGDNFFPRTVGHDDPIGKALECRTVGTRLALVTSVQSLLGKGAGSQLGVSDSSSVVMAIEVLNGYPGKADGVNRLQDNSLPAVVTATDGQPGIVLPNVNKAPTTFRSAVVKAGGGEKLKKGEHALVQYQSWSWDTTATVNQSTWRAGAPGIATVGEVLQQSDGTQIPFPTRLAGESVGSQLLYVYPGQQGNPATVWVIDVLGVVK